MGRLWGHSEADRGLPEAHRPVLDGESRAAPWALLGGVLVPTLHKRLQQVVSGKVLLARHLPPVTS